MAKKRERTVQERLQALHDEACDLECRYNDQAAEALFRECLVLAEPLANPLTNDHLRWHIAASLLSQQKYRQSLAMLLPLIQEHQPYGDDEEDSNCRGITGGSLRAVALYHVCLASMAIPTDWTEIESRLALMRQLSAVLPPDEEATPILRMAYWLTRLGFLERSGRHREGLKGAQLAEPEVPKRFRHLILAQAALLAAQAGEQRQARGYLDRVRRGGEELPFAAEMAGVILARQAGDAGRAVHLSMGLPRPRWAIHEGNNGFNCKVWQIECRLAAGQLQDARYTLDSLYYRWGRKQSWQRYEHVRLRAEYRLALARRAAGLPSRDCRYVGGEERYEALKSTPAAQRQVSRAKVGFARAARLAERLERESGLPVDRSLAGRVAEAARLKNALMPEGSALALHPRCAAPGLGAVKSSTART